MKELWCKNLDEYFAMSDKYSGPKTIKGYETTLLEGSAKKLFKAITYHRVALIGFEAEVSDEQIPDLVRKCRAANHKEALKPLRNVWLRSVWHLGSYEYPCYRAQLHALFETYQKDSRLLFDAGCGSEGRYLSNLPIDAWGIGLDIDPKNIQIAKKRHKSNNVSFVVGDIQNLPFFENMFDLIVCCDVLEHVKVPEKAVKELTSILRKRGALLVTTSNLLNPAMFFDILLPNAVSKKIIDKLSGPFFYERTRRFNPYDLKKKLREYRLFANVLTVGHPPMGKPWRYEIIRQYSNTSPPKIFYLWIAFNKLTNIKILRNLKEIILAIARK